MTAASLPLPEPGRLLPQLKRQSRHHLALTILTVGGCLPWLWAADRLPAGVVFASVLLCGIGGVIEMQRWQATWQRFLLCRRTEQNRRRRSRPDAQPLAPTPDVPLCYDGPTPSRYDSLAFHSDVQRWPGSHAHPLRPDR